MTDPDPDAGLRRLFVTPERARDRRLEVEDRGATAAGHVFSRGLRLVSVVERQERHGHLTHRQAAAARQLYRDYVFGVRGVRDREAATGTGGAVGYTDSQLDAAARYREVHDRLGSRLFPLVFAVCCDDVSVPDYARLRGLNPTSTMALLRVGLDMAADCLAIHE
jgi:hypothetical protein